MILYVETNFVLELALSREQSAACRALLDLAKETPGPELVIPSFCAGEAYEAWGRIRLSSEEAHRHFNDEADSLARSAPHRARARMMRRTTAALAIELDRSENALDDTLQEILGAAARVIPLSPTIHAQALKLRRSPGFRRTQDALVYASVLSDLDPPTVPAAAVTRLAGPHVFATRDRRDFVANPDIKRQLGSLDCDLVGNFDHALARVQSELRRGT